MPGFQRLWAPLLVAGSLFPLTLAAAQQTSAPPPVASSAPGANAQPELEALNEVPTADKIALVVGIDHYDHIGSLRFAKNDALSFYNLLVNDLGFDRRNVELITEKSAVQTNEDCTPKYQNIIDAKNRFRKRLTARSVALVYYSGHGVHRGNIDYWIPSDARMADEESIPESCVSATALLNQLRQMQPAPRRVLFFFDACRNVEDTEGVKGTRIADGVAWEPLTLAGGDWAFLYGCKRGQFSREYKQPPPEHGLFTNYLIKALTPNKSGSEELFGIDHRSISSDDQRVNITYRSLKEFVKAGVESDMRLVVSNDPQNPLKDIPPEQLQSPDGQASQDEMVLVRTRKPSSTGMKAAASEAEQALRDGRNDEARDKARAVLMLEPNNPDMHCVVGEVLFREKKYSEALDEANAAIKVNSGHLIALALAQRSLQVLLELARPRSMRKPAIPSPGSVRQPPALRRETRVELVALTGAEERADVRPLVSNANQLLQIGNLGEALEEARRAVKGDAESGEAWLVLGRALFLLRENGEAADAFARARQLAPNSQRVRAYLEGAERAKQLDLAEQHVREAFGLLVERRLGEAADAVVKALQSDNANARAYVARGCLRYQLKQSTGAIADFERALELDPTILFARNRLELARKDLLDASSLSRAEAARRLMEQKQPQEAKRIAREARELDGRSAPVQLILGQLALAEQDAGGAILAFQEALTLEPASQEALTGIRAALGLVPNRTPEELVAQSTALLATDAAGAETRAREAIARNRDSGPAWLALAAAHLRLATQAGANLKLRGKLYEDALRESSEAARLGAAGVQALREEALRGRRTVNAVSLVNQAVELLIHDQVLEAANQARLALEEDPENADAQGILGYALLMSGKDRGEVDAAIQRALQVERQQAVPSPLAHVAVGTSLYFHRQWKEAARELERALELLPSNPTSAARRVLTLNNLGVINARQGKKELAERQWEEVTRLDPDYPYSYANLGSRYFENGKYREASEAYRSAIDRERRNGSFHIWRAAALYRMKEREAARMEAVEAYRLGVLKHPVYRLVGFKP